MAQDARGMPFSRADLRCGVCRCGVKAENVETRLERHSAPPSHYVGRSELKVIPIFKSRLPGAQRLRRLVTRLPVPFLYIPQRQ